MHLFTHIVPEDKIGGVEVAARSCQSFEDSSFSFRVVYIFRNPGRNGVRGVLAESFRLAWELRRDDSNVYILSLWKSAIVAVFLKLLGSKAKFVTLLHSPVRAHVFDKLFTWISIKMSTEVWGDSQASLHSLSSWYSCPSREISFLANKFDALPNSVVAPMFAFWGRLSAEKNLKRSLGIFRDIRINFEDARYFIIGPDGGMRDEVLALSIEYGIEEAVDILDAVDVSDIPQIVRECSFYLQTSSFEGLGMSIVEAMQMGLVPVVTPVGGIREYCVDGLNAVFVYEENDNVVAKVCELIGDPAQHEKMRQSCIGAFINKPTYRESIIGACRSVIAA